MYWSSELLAGTPYWIRPQGSAVDGKYLVTRARDAGSNRLVGITFPAKVPPRGSFNICAEPDVKHPPCDASDVYLLKFPVVSTVWFGIKLIVVGGVLRWRVP